MIPGNETLFIHGIQQVIFTTPWVMALMIFMARWLILANLFFVVYFLTSKSKKDRHVAIEIAWSFIFALIITTVISYFISRDRPFVAVPDIVLLIPPPFNSSFPSGHTGAAIAIALTIFNRNKLMGAISFLIAAFVAFGRLATGVHYPTDLLGGVFVGLLSFSVVMILHRELGSSDILNSAKRYIHK
ncbi:MAG: phosphatase PAP2 family protein [Patescibacteria group bacterium]